MSTPRFTVRPAREADLPAAARLAGNLVRHYHARNPRRFAILADPPEPGYERFLRAQLARDDAVVMVAELAGSEGASNGELVGYALGSIEPRDWMLLLDRAGWIHDLIVDARYRRRGIGEALTRAMVARLRQMGAPRVVLLTLHDDAARRLYERIGFRPTLTEMMLDDWPHGSADGAALASHHERDV